MAGGPASTSPLPSTVTVVSDPFEPISTFTVGGDTVSVNLISNGDFTTRDLTGQQGNLDGWTTYKLNDTTIGSAGQWLVQSGRDPAR